MKAIVMSSRSMRNEGDRKFISSFFYTKLSSFFL